jgi:hypothetical protein
LKFQELFRDSTAIFFFLAVILECSIIVLLSKHNPRIDPKSSKIILEAENGKEFMDLTDHKVDLFDTKGPRSYNRSKSNPTIKGVSNYENTIQTQPEPDMVAKRANLLQTITTEQFLEAMIEKNSKFLLGRDTTCAKLGIPSYTGRRLINVLKKDGRIRAVGKRLELVQDYRLLKREVS